MDDVPNRDLRVRPSLAISAEAIAARAAQSERRCAALAIYTCLGADDNGTKVTDVVASGLPAPAFDPGPDPGGMVVMPAVVGREEAPGAENDTTTKNA